MATSVLAMKSNFRPVILIPVYNHPQTIISTVESILVYGVCVLMVDDGSNDDCRLILVNLQEQYKERVHLIRLDENSGKGAAVKQGFIKALTLGYSHALQVDADGQHDVASIPAFLKSADKFPEKLIVGYPEYNDTVPKMRLYGRYFTHVWVWINTLSFSIRDSMCGFRVYPLVGITQLLNKSSCGDRMNFDTEILVRWIWQGNEIINLPTKVHYPENGVSHFLVWRDNALISWMHTRLFFGMLLRLPVLIARKLHAK